MVRTKIDSFSGAFTFLSNFYFVQIKHEGIMYNSVEAAYQAAKTKDAIEKKFIATMSPGEAKKYGRRVKLREDWEEIKLAVMEELVKKKFRNPSLRKKLMATGDAELIEGNWWGDTYWGVCKGKGENHLGEILMSIRSGGK